MQIFLEPQSPPSPPTTAHINLSSRSQRVPVCSRCPSPGKGGGRRLGCSSRCFGVQYQPGSFDAIGWKKKKKKAWRVAEPSCDAGAEVACNTYNKAVSICSPPPLPSGICSPPPIGRGPQQRCWVLGSISWAGLGPRGSAAKLFKTGPCFLPGLETSGLVFFFPQGLALLSDTASPALSSGTGGVLMSVRARSQQRGREAAGVLAPETGQGEVLPLSPGC